ncbi:hypothetical protein BH09SUM1_BH09SUM1_26690 [soil metagenome]
MNKILWLILGVLAPPIVVAVLEGFNQNFWINLLLWVFCVHIGAVVHCWILILSNDYPQTRG